MDQAGKSVGIWRLIALAAILIGSAAYIATLEPADAQPFILGLLAILAIVGVFALFAFVVGLLQFSSTPQISPHAEDTLNALDSGVLVTDVGGRVVFSNAAYSRLTGVDRQKDVRSLERVFAAHSDAADIVYRLVSHGKFGRRGHEDIRMPAPLTGESAAAEGARWYRLSVGPMDEGQRANKLTLWQVRDITEEKQDQENIFLELQHAVDHLDHAPAGFFSADRDGRLVYINATLSDWLGLDLTAFEPGELTLDAIVQGDNVELLSSPSGTSGEAKTEVVDLDLVKQNGEHLPVRLLHRIAFTPEGVTSSSRTVVLNRSPGEDSAEALRAAEVQFARFFNNTPIGISSIGRDGHLRRCNAAFLRAFPGNGSADGQRLADLVAKDNKSEIQDLLARLAAGESEFDPVEIHGPEGEEPRRSFQLYVNPLSETDQADDADMAVVYLLETTQQRVLEQQFAQSQKMQAIGQLAGGIAHDFNNVLTAIIGYSDLLLGNHPAGDPSFSDIKNIQQNAHRAARLVGQLLAFSRQQTLRPEILSLTDVLADVPDMVDRLLGEKAKLSVHHGRDLWPIKADANQLDQVIVNLAVNARDAMPQGGTITISTENITPAECANYDTKGMPDGEYVLLTVADQGTGMSKEVMEKIFDPFFTTKEVGKGTGLGLATVYGIIKQSGGFVYPESTVGRGTTFRIFLPRYEETEEDRTAVVEEEKKEESRDLTGSATILLVEDEEAVRSFSARALSSRGYNVLEAESGQHALEVMDEVDHEVDLVVSDVVMPEMNGPTMLGILREHRPDLKVIFVSGYAEEAFKNDLPENESFSFLPKPFSLKQLTATVRDVLDMDDDTAA